MFKKKEKKTPEQIRRESDEKISSTTDRLKVQLIQIENKKNVALDQVMKARSLKLPAQEEKAKELLAQCLGSSKRINGMIMTLELAVESRDLAEINYDFLQCIGNISDEICVSTQKANAKKVQNKYAKALYASNKKLKETEELVDVSTHIATTSIADTPIDVSQYDEYSDEIDSMIENCENDANYMSKLKKQKI